MNDKYGVCPKCGNTVLFFDFGPQDESECSSCGTITKPCGIYNPDTFEFKKFDGTIVQEGEDPARVAASKEKVSKMFRNL